MLVINAAETPKPRIAMSISFARHSDCVAARRGPQLMATEDQALLGSPFEWQCIFRALLRPSYHGQRNYLRVATIQNLYSNDATSQFGEKQQMRCKHALTVVSSDTSMLTDSNNSCSTPSSRDSKVTIMLMIVNNAEIL